MVKKFYFAAENHGTDIASRLTLAIFYFAFRVCNIHCKFYNHNLQFTSFENEKHRIVVLNQIVCSYGKHGLGIFCFQSLFYLSYIFSCLQLRVAVGKRFRLACAKR